MTQNIIIWVWLTAFLHPVIFPYVLHTTKNIEKWWDKKRVLWHIEQLRKIEENIKNSTSWYCITATSQHRFPPAAVGGERRSRGKRWTEQRQTPM